MITFPASTGQAWYVRAVNSGRANDNVELGCRLRGKPDLPRLRRAVELLVARHPSLRTTFADRDGRVLQQIHDPAPLAIEDVDGTDPDALIEFATDPFQLHGGPLVRAALVRLSTDDNLLVLVAHHAVCDGWSWALLYEDLAELYRAAGEDRTPRLPPSRLPPSHIALQISVQVMPHPIQRRPVVLQPADQQRPLQRRNNQLPQRLAIHSQLNLPPRNSFMG